MPQRDGGASAPTVARHLECRSLMRELTGVVAEASAEGERPAVGVPVVAARRDAVTPSTGRGQETAGMADREPRNRSEAPLIKPAEPERTKCATNNVGSAAARRGGCSPASRPTNSRGGT